MCEYVSKANGRLDTLTFYFLPFTLITEKYYCPPQK